MKKLLLGDFAVARGAWEAGVKVAAAYPGTPSTEITEELARYDDVYSEWSPNEKVALEVATRCSLRPIRAWAEGWSSPWRMTRPSSHRRTSRIPA